MSDDDLDPQVAAALAHLEPAPRELMDRHINTALAEMRRPITLRASARWLGVAAAFVALIAGVAAYRTSTPPGDTGVAAAGHTATTMPTKTGADTSGVAEPPETVSDCPSSLEGSRQIGEYQFGDGQRGVNLTDTAMEIVDLADCASLEMVELPSLPRSRTTCIPSLLAGVQMVGPYVSAGSSVVVLATDTELTVIGGPQCGVIARVPQPSRE